MMTAGDEYDFSAACGGDAAGDAGDVGRVGWEGVVCGVGQGVEIW